MPFVLGTHVFIIDMHFDMESITPTSNQSCANMDDKTLILREVVFQENLRIWVWSGAVLRGCRIPPDHTYILKDTYLIIQFNHNMVLPTIRNIPTDILQCKIHHSNTIQNNLEARPMYFEKYGWHTLKARLMQEFDGEKP